MKTKTKIEGCNYNINLKFLSAIGLFLESTRPSELSKLQPILFKLASNDTNNISNIIESLKTQHYRRTGTNVSFNKMWKKAHAQTVFRLGENGRVDEKQGAKI